MSEIPNIQDEEAEIPIPIKMVGFKNIRMLAGRIFLNGLEIIIVPRFDVYIDLPVNRRAIHTSRLYHAIMEVIKDYSGKVVKLEEMARRIAEKLLKDNPHSSKAYVNIYSNAYYRAESPITRSISYEPFNLFVKIRAVNSLDRIEILQSIGVETYGLTACPCAREVVKTLYHGLEATHMQRARARVFIQFSNNLKIDIIELLNVVKSSFSSPLYSYLKRVDEAKVVVDSLESTRFVEDTLREIVKKIIERWSNLPDNSRIYAYVESIESIHPQNIAACIDIDVGRARLLLKR